MITLLRLRTLSKKVWLWAKRFWWAIALVLFFIVAGLIAMLTKNAAVLAAVVDLIDAKRDQHDQEMETLSHIHNTEIAEKNLRLQEHLKRKKELKKKFEDRGDVLDKTKEAEHKKLVDEGYNNPEKLAEQIADAFGL